MYVCFVRPFPAYLFYYYYFVSIFLLPPPKNPTGEVLVYPYQKREKISVGRQTHFFVSALVTNTQFI